jgi:AcrR family transcriptional regulator
MKTRKLAPTTRAAILEAANRVIRASGAAALTLDAVAREAGVSKGGLLYHFPSKDALIEGMVGHLLGCFGDEIDQAAAREPRDAGAWLRAYARATAAPGQQLNDTTASLLAAVANNPELLEPARERFAAWQRRAEQDGIDPARATIVRLAADGLWLAELFGFAPPAEPLRSRVLAELLNLTRENLT